MLNWFRSKSLDSHLNESEELKKVKILGIKFKISKINPLDYLDGSQAVRSIYQTYQVGTDNQKELTQGDINAIKKHHSDVILASVKEPALTRKQGEDGIWIEHLFKDWELVAMLYDAIMTYSYGKKKVL